MRKQNVFLRKVVSSFLVLFFSAFVEANATELRDTIYPGTTDALNLHELTSTPLVSQFAESALLEYLKAVDGAKNLPYVVPRKVWEQSSFKDQWMAVVTEKNGFKKARAMATLYDQLEAAKEARLRHVYTDLKSSEFYFGERVRWSTEFDFNEMSKTIGGLMRLNSGAAFTTDTSWCSGVSSINPQGEQPSAWLGAQPAVHILRPLDGSFLDSITTPEGDAGCGLKFSFQDAGKAELFEEIITKQDPVLFYFGKLASVNRVESLSFELDRVELWARKDGQRYRTQFALYVDESMGVDQHYNYVANKAAKAYGVGLREANGSIEELSSSGLILANNRQRYFQFFDEGQTLYMRRDGGGPGSTFGRYVREETNGNPVYRLRGLEGSGLSQFPLHLYLPDTKSKRVREGTVYFSSRHGGSDTSFHEFSIKQKYTGSLKETFDSIRGS